MTAEILLSRLNGVRQVRTGDWWASCPTSAHPHGDRSRGLHVTEAQDGTLLVHCFAGCAPAEVLAAVGLELADLFPNKIERPRGRQACVNPRDLLRLLTHSATVLWIFCEDAVKGLPISETDLGIVRKAWGDMQRILREAGH